MAYSFVPAPADAAATAVPLIYSAGPEMFTYMFARGGHAAEDFLRFAYTDGGGFFGHRNHVAVFDQDELVAIGAFYSGREYQRLSLQTIAQALRFYRLPVALGMARDFLHVGRWTPAPPRNMQYVADLGVAPQRRGQGVGAALLEQQRKVALELGRSCYALDVANNNPRAQALYERLGFVQVKERRFSGPDRGIAIPASRRLEMRLPST